MFSKKLHLLCVYLSGDSLGFFVVFSAFQVHWGGGNPPVPLPASTEDPSSLILTFQFQMQLSTKPWDNTAFNRVHPGGAKCDNKLNKPSWLFSHATTGVNHICLGGINIKDWSNTNGSRSSRLCRSTWTLVIKHLKTFEGLYTSRRPNCCAILPSYISRHGLLNSLAGI